MAIVEVGPHVLRLKRSDRGDVSPSVHSKQISLGDISPSSLIATLFHSRTAMRRIDTFCDAITKTLA
jgi:hypothetical protein